MLFKKPDVSKNTGLCLCANLTEELTAGLRGKWRDQVPGKGAGQGQPALARAGGGGGGATTHPIGRPGMMKMAGRPSLSSLARVSAPGGRLGGVKLLKTDADVPSHYRTDPKRFTKLAEDPDHAGRVSAKTRAEAMAGLEVEQQGLVKGPIVRGGTGIEYHDAAGTPYDVKAPVSTPAGETWSFDSQGAANSITDELRKKTHTPPNFPTSPPGEYLNPLTNAFEPRWVILDSSYMNAADHAALWQELNKTLTPSEQGRIIEVNTHV